MECLDKPQSAEFKVNCGGLLREQAIVEIVLLLTIFICVILILVPKPLILYHKNKKFVVCMHCTLFSDKTFLFCIILNKCNHFE